MVRVKKKNINIDGFLFIDTKTSAWATETSHGLFVALNKISTF